MMKPRVDLDDLLRKLVSEHVSDIHIKAGKPPMTRTDGILDVMKEFPVLSADDSYSVACQVFRLSASSIS